MDAFYASIEQRDDPALRGRPVVVGGRSRRGVVCAASYEARPFGVRSAMSMVEALRRCPHAVVVPPRFSQYQSVSGKVFDVFRRYTPLVEGLSLDEAFLDVTGSRSLFGDGATIAGRIKAEIAAETGLTASAGAASSKFVAKIASDLDKPDGLVVVPEDVAAFLAPLPIARMWGVGPKAAARLEDAGFRTIGDLAATDADALEVLLGSWGRAVHALARGEDERPVVPAQRPKSVGAEETFERDLIVVEDLEAELLAQSRRVATRLIRAGLWGDVVQVKVKYRDHSAKTRQLHVEEPVADTDSIYRAACSLLRRFPDLARGVRLTGVAVSGLTDQPQKTLFPDEGRVRREKLERVTSVLRERFGSEGITRGRLLGRPTREGPEPGGRSD